METFSDPALEQSLAALARLFKLASYYHDGHPALQQPLRQAIDLMRQLLQRQPEGLLLKVRRQGFEREGQLLRCGSTLPADLATRLFVHRVTSLIVLDDLTERQLLLLVRLLLMEPAQMTAAGGLQHQLEQHRVTGLLLNQFDLTTAARYRQQLRERQQAQGETAAGSGFADGSANQAGTPAAPLPADLSRQLRLLQKLIDEDSPTSRQNFARQHALLLQAVQSLLTSHQRDQILPALQQWDFWCHNDQTGPFFRQHCLDALNRLSQLGLVNFLLDLVSHDKRQRPLTLRLIGLLGEQAGPLLWQRLIEEQDPQIRRLLSQLLSQRITEIQPLLLRHLHDERWFVVRNALVLLAESRDVRLTDDLAAQLYHSDERVVREAIRALARIRQPAACQALLRYLDTPACPQAPMALRALGSQNDPAALKRLLWQINQRDPLLRELACCRSAIEALGEQADPAARASLQRIAGHRPWLHRNRYRQLRLAAIEALTSLRDTAVDQQLQQLSHDADRAVAEAARQVLQKPGTGR
ncbi:MAG: HEAT repeat domain-containing protein [Desulfuromonas thiophila]|nr:HEAT repeat domain-containing protein [Desulfuromonas thiophila]